MAKRPAPRTSSKTSAAPLWLFGQHAVEAALRNPKRSVERMLYTGSLPPALQDLANRRGLTPEAVAKPDLARILTIPDAPHQGLALLVRPLPPLDLSPLSAASPRARLVFALDQVTDPQNLGAILRVSAAFAVSAVLVPGDNSAPVNGLCAKAASGALEIVPLVTVTNLARALGTLRDAGYWTVGLDAHAPTSLADFHHEGDLLVVLGSEGKGLRRLVTASCDQRLRLPISAAVESLNVAVTAGIAAYALARHPAGE